MKNLLLYLLSCILLFACKKEIVQDNDQSFRKAVVGQSVVETVVSPTAPSLYIPEDEEGWEGGRLGLWNGSKQVAYTTVGQGLYNAYGGTVPYMSYQKIIYYDCPIAWGFPGNTWDTSIYNPITRSGTMDFVTNLGVQEKPLGITVYANGGVYLGRKKDEFAYSPTNARLGAARGINYSGKSFIWLGWADRYNNTAIIPKQDGLFVIAVTPEYGAMNPTTSLLPIRVIGNEVFLDTTSIAANAAHPATNYKAVMSGKGRNRGVQFTWEGDSYAYCIEKWNGSEWVMILRWFDGRSWFYPGGTMKDKFRMVSRAQGRIPDARTLEFGVSKK